VSEEKLDSRAGLGRRELLRRLMASAGAAGAAAALPVAGYAVATGPAMIAVPQAEASSTAPGMSLGAAEPPDPSLSAADWKPKFLDDHQVSTVQTVGDLLIPATDTPGAKAAQVERFIDLLLSTDAPGTDEESEGGDLTDILMRRGTLEARKRYVEALNWLDGHCLAQHGQPFTGLDRSQQEAVLDRLTRAGTAPDPELAKGREHFGLIKGSIIVAYYTSEAGEVQELKYQMNPYQPGYTGCEHPDQH
jgi:gluconate 2-dehydrogenase gamma chain